MSRFDDKPDAPQSPLNSFFNSDRYVGQGLATYGDLDHAILDDLQTIEDVDADPDAVTEVASDEDTLFAVARSHWGVDNPNLADEIATWAAMMDRVSVSEVAMDAVSVSEVAMDAVSTSQTAMDAVSTSQTAMDAVSVSAVAMEAVAASSIAMDAVIASDDVALPTIVETETAMNEVSLSDLALDSLWESEVAWGMIRDLSMAVGKFVAGRAGLSGYDYADIDAVAGSQTAMDAVSTSETAMDAVAASIIARTAAISSAYTYDTIWSTDLASGTIWDTGDFANDPTNSGWWSQSFDLSNSSTFSVYTRADNGSPDLKIKIGGSEVFSTDSDHTSWTERSFDVSSYSGETTIELGLEGYDNSPEDYISDRYNGRSGGESLYIRMEGFGSVGSSSEHAEFSDMKLE